MSTIDKIFELARSKGISNAELAKKLNLNPQAITDWKSGKSRSYNKYLYQIAAFLGTTPEYLKGETDTVGKITRGEITDTERKFLEAYRAHPEMHDAINKLLGIGAD